VDGVPRALFQARSGLGGAALEKGLRVAQAKGLLACDARSIRPTPRGRLFLNDLVALFLPAPK